MGWHTSEDKEGLFGGQAASRGLAAHWGSRERSSAVGSCEQRAVDVQTFGLILHKPNVS